MKAKIKRTGNYWRWYLYSNNKRCVANGRYYTRRDNAIKGFVRFLDSLKYKRVFLDGMPLG